MNKYLKITIAALCAVLLGVGAYYGIIIKPRHYAAFIEWEDCAKFNDITYQSCLFSPNITQDMMRDKYAVTNFVVSQNIHYVKYNFKNGDGAIIPEETEFYRVKGYDSDFRLIAYIKGRNYYALYEAINNPHAKIGSDILDIRGRVKSIKILSSSDEKITAEIKNQNDIIVFVDRILDSEVGKMKYVHNTAEKEFIFELCLEDGTSTKLRYNINKNIIVLQNQKISLPTSFRADLHNFLYEK